METTYNDILNISKQTEEKLKIFYSLYSSYLDKLEKEEISKSFKEYIDTLIDHIEFCYKVENM